MNFSKLKLNEMAIGGGALGTATKASANAAMSSKNQKDPVKKNMQSSMSTSIMGNKTRDPSVSLQKTTSEEYFSQLRQEVEEIKKYEEEKSDWRSELSEALVDGQERADHPYVTVMPTGDENLIQAIKQMRGEVQDKKKGDKDSSKMEEAYGAQRDGIRDRRHDGYENKLTDDDRKEAKNAKSKLDMEREAKAKKVADARARLNRDIAARKVNEEQLDELSGNFLRDASSKANEERRKAHRDGDSERADDKQAQSKRLFRAAQDKKRKEQTVSEDMSGMSQKSGDKRSTESGAGMTAAGVKKYNSRTGGNLKTAVTTPPSKLKAGSKAAGRRKSFCARSKSWNGERGKAARARWNC